MTESQSYLGDALLKVYTLGNFRLYTKDKELSERNCRSSKMWDLFKYIVTNRDRQIPVEYFFDVLWQDENCSNPVKALQNLVYRLKNELNIKGAQPIVFSQGCYSWNRESLCWIDAAEFENLCHQAQSLSSEYTDEAICLYMEALSLYKGEYLPEYSYNDWVIPVRNHLRNLYIKCVAELYRIFGSRGRDEDCAEVCRSAILVEKYEEQFHIWLMESLVAMDKGHEAQKHYEYLTSLFYRDLGLKPSRQIQQALKVIKKSLNDNAQNEVAPEDFRPCDKDINSALFCDSNTFRKLYESEMRKSEKSENQITVVQFIINSSGRILPGNVLDSLTDIFKKSFRKGDLITRLNGSRFAVMLHGIGARHAESVANRAADQIRTGLDSCAANLSYTLHRIGRGEDDLYKMK